MPSRLPRADAAYERLHQRIVSAIMAYEERMRRRGMKVRKVVAVYDAEKHPFYDIQIQEEPSFKPRHPVEREQPVEDNEGEAAYFEELEALNKTI